MNVEMVVRNVQIILAPVVLMTVCAILVQGLLGRYASISDRLRALARERLDLLGGEAGRAPLRTERLRLVDAQLPRLLHHHRRIHDALLAFYVAEGIFIASMFVIAAAAFTVSTDLATDALGVFLLGAGVVLVGVLLTALEVRASHAVLDDEVRGMLKLGP